MPTEHAFEYVMQVGKEGTCWRSNIYILPQVFAPVCTIITTFDADQDQGRLLKGAFYAICRSKP